MAFVGEHKGYGLALAHEMLTSILTGGKLTRTIKSLYEEEKSGIQGTCHTFMALDPDCFIGRSAFKESIDSYVTSIKRSAKAKNVEEILVPGEPEFRTEKDRRAAGIPLIPNTVSELVALSQSLGLTLASLE